MRHFLRVPRASLCAAAVCSAGVASRSAPSSTAVTAAFTCAVRWQAQSRPYGRGGGGSTGRSTVVNRSDSEGSQLLNKTKDGELSFDTRVAMRDDSVILTEIFKHVPPQGAISIKSLFSALNDDVQEALCEKHNGLRSFVEQRKQIFTVRPHPTDGVLYVVGNPLVAKQYATRDLQLKTMRQMMGLTEEETAMSQRQQRPGSNFGPRGGGGGGGRGGGGNYNRNYRRDNSGDDRGQGQGQDQRRYQGNNANRSYSNSNSNSNNTQYGGSDRRRPPPPPRDDRRSYGGGSRSNPYNNSGPPQRPNRGPMGSHAKSFGTRS
ncbi:putative mitochondrial mitochondrial RNA binding complex 1 subunit [Leptomonas pyrrhocoris]|uniref:Putative mitochondrial mitochondrial RNA binding complex 1 subunit n=1 Tax=Leptomonas pyrrhocoris TaxID=157538 RepID=A0A0N0VF45_LEPPY|nr:putative mitochondrial mitochondrial RNA binding complex 1 subunit [Leptomonas pyrrhocoris]KPA79674.1 putative mitochondrial mitochondrial RNA binding complex 1 subunit [Leptomonas pyrrhocoris]|eukprot:XP_015658113.1 putative mitochondrial mitochondrial RNA binding complex 1 subunit [Leptomonas pyrrhocoris]